jgi:hypothetical protein
MRGAEGHLLRLGEKVVGIPVEHQSSHRHERHQFLGNDLGGIEHVETESLRLLLRDDLKPQFVLRIRAGLDRFPQIAAMKIRIGTGNLHGLVPHQRMGAGLRRPMELHEMRLSLVVDEAVGVDAKTLHRAIAARNRPIRHRPHQHVRDLGHQRREVPEGVMGRRGLRHRKVRLRLRCVHEVGKLHRILDEEDGDVVTDEIPVALVRVELDGESTNVPGRIGRAAFAEHRREPHEHRRLLADFGEERGAGELGDRVGTFEDAVRRGAARVDDALGNPLVVEVRDLFTQNEVFEEGRSAQPGFQ